MLFGKKKLHPLPKFPETVAPAFKQLCTSLPDGEYEGFKAEVGELIQELLTKLSQSQPAAQEVVHQLIDCTWLLLDRYENGSGGEKKLILGAIRYFLIADDPLPDHEFISGFHDDAQIMNHVLEELGMHEHFIKL